MHNANAKKWAVKYIDDESNGEQVAYFASQEEANIWIKNIEQQERYDPTGFEVIDGPLLCNEDNVDELFDSTNKSSQLQFVIESCNASYGNSSICGCNGEKYDEVFSKDFAYDVVKRSIMKGMFLDSVWSIDDGHHYVAQIHGESNNSFSDRAKWIGYLQKVEQFISCMLENGVGDIWLIDFANGLLDDVWTLCIGFNLLESPFGDDK